jgi:hypothetical protein
MPRSVRRCLGRCALLLGGVDQSSPGLLRTHEALESVRQRVAAAGWPAYLLPATAASGEAGGGVQLDPARIGDLVAVLSGITEQTYAIHEVVTDGFINHQILID